MFFLMGTASAGYPSGITSHYRGKFGAFPQKVEFIGSNFPLHVEFPRSNLYPRSVSTTTSKVITVASLISFVLASETEKKKEK